MFKLTKEERADKASLEVELKNAIDNVTETTDDETIDAYNQVASKIEGFLVDVSNRLRDEFDEKSDKWLESDAASPIDEFIDLWEDLTISQIEDGNIDDLSLVLDDFEDLPEEPE